MRRFLLWMIPALTCAGIPLLTSAQTYFNERYTNNGNQSAALMVMPTDSGYLVGGQAYHTPIPNSQSVVLRRLNTQGQQTHMRYYGRPNFVYYSSFGGEFLPTPDGGYAMVGAYTSPNADYTALLWRFNTLGDTLWVRAYPGDSSRTTSAGCGTKDGGFALVGISIERTVTAARRVLLIRTDSLGNLLWERTYGNRFDNFGNHVYPTDDGGFLLSGYTRSSPASGNLLDTYVLKVDSLGTLEWERNFRTGSLNYGPGTAIPTQDGNYAVVATQTKQRVNRYNQHRPIVYKLDRQGNTIWQKEIGPARYITEFFAFRELADGSLVAAGQQSDPTGATPTGNGYPEGVMFKVCADGDSVWYRVYEKLPGQRSHNYLRAMMPTPDGGFVGAGFLFSNAPDTGSNDAWVFKTDSAGYLQAGGAPVTVQCRQPTGGLPEATVPVVMLYPNPTPDGRFTVEAKPGATLSVSDALGRVLWQRPMEVGRQEVDLRAYPSGLYLVRLRWPNGQQLTRKVVR